MSGLIVHRGNRIEELAQALVELTAQPPPDPFARECIAVQSRAMERWLSMRLASAHGVWANPEFLFPRKVLERCIEAVLELDETASGPFEPEILTWSVAALLPHLLERPEFAPLARYLEGDVDERRRLQLARRIARAFDDYVVYRPELLRRWESGAEEDWQATLWRALAQRAGRVHLAALVERLAEAIERGGGARAELPARISLFGITHLPPLFLRALQALSRVLDVHLFALTPSRARVWEDHPLLASLGELPFEFQRLLAESEVREIGHFCDPGDARSDLLARVQSDLLVGRAPLSRGERRERVDPGDRSIGVHSCYGPLREVEVLHDQLLACLEEDPELRPEQIAVLTPDVERYAPLIEAVFDSPDLRRRLPVSVGDLSARARSELIDAFGRLLRLLEGRVTSAQLLDLLGSEPLRERFELEASDLDLLTRWVERAGIRWGVDAAHRGSVGQPAVEQNTWRFGLDRLLLGYAWPGDAGDLFAGVLPQGDAEGQSAQVLGSFVDFCEQIFELRTDFERPRCVDDWAQALDLLLEQLFALRDRDVEAIQAIREVLRELARSTRAARFDEPVGLALVRAELESAFARAEPLPAHGFLAGGVTVSSLRLARALPFRVIAICGLGVESFPRSDGRPDFDRMRERRRGDPSRRAEDTQLFLTALLSVGRRLILTYGGRHARHGSELPPSVVVDELLDALEQSYAPAAGSTLREQVTLSHPLQAFSPRYFDGSGDGRLFSFNPAACRAARGLSGASQSPRVFIDKPLEPEAEVLLELELDDLIAFLRHPSRWFLQRGLGLFLPSEETALPEREPIDLSPLERWEVGSAVLEAALEGRDFEEAVRRLRAQGALPLGALGHSAAADIAREVRQLTDRVEWSRVGEARPPLEFERELAGVRLSGRLEGLREGGLVWPRFARVERASELALWASHLTLSWLSGGCRSHLLGRPASGRGARWISFSEPEDPQQGLEDLVRLYCEGLKRVLPLYPRASRAYASARLHQRPEAEAVDKARKALEGAARSPGDRADPYIRLALRGVGEPLDADFRALALRVFEPLLAHRLEEGAA